MMRLIIESPNPVQEIFLVRFFIVLKNSWNNSSTSSCFMPIPVSEILIFAWFPTFFTSISSLPSSRLYLMALEIKLVKILRTSSLSASIIQFPSRKKSVLSFCCLISFSTNSRISSPISFQSTETISLRTVPVSIRLILIII